MMSRELLCETLIVCLEFHPKTAAAGRGRLCAARFLA